MLASIVLIKLHELSEKMHVTANGSSNLKTCCEKITQLRNEG